MAEPKKALNTTPIQRPEMLNSVSQIFGRWWKNQIRHVEVCVPAIFLGYLNDDRSTGVGRVQPLVDTKTALGEFQEHGVKELPIHQIQHGTFAIDVPLVRGDTGWIIAGDREDRGALDENAQIQAADSGIGRKDSDGNAIGNAGPQPPIEETSHSFEFGFFLPDKWGGIPLPSEFRDSLVIGQVNPNASSHGRIVMDPDGTIHVLSAKWEDTKSHRLRGGAVYVDLAWKDGDSERTTLSEILNQIKANEGDGAGNYILRARETVLGDLDVMEDPDSPKGSGNLSVEKSAKVGGGLDVGGKASVGNGLAVEGITTFNGRVTVKDNTSRNVKIWPEHLQKGVGPESMKPGDAQFVRRTILTGKDEARSRAGKVYLKREQVFVLSDKGIPLDPVEISGLGSGGGGGGGGGDTDTFVIEPFYVRRSAEGEDSYLCYLPDHCLYFDGEPVDIRGVSVVDGYWHGPDQGVWSGGTLWCWISEDSQGTYKAELEIGSEWGIRHKTGMLAYFAIAELSGGGAGLYEGAKQIAAGAMVLSDTSDMNPSPFDLSIETLGNRVTAFVHDPIFYWNGERKVIGGNLSFNVGNFGIDLFIVVLVRADGTYKSGTITPDPETVETEDGDKKYVYQIYALDGNGKTEMDYRHTFLELGVRVEPDNVSTEFIPLPSGQSDADGDEGRLQIKGFKEGAPEDGKTIADYLNGKTEIPTDGIQVLTRQPTSSGKAGLVYLPLAALKGGGDSSDSEEEPITKKGKKILTGLRWDESSHKLMISSATVDVVNGLITRWADNRDEEIPTTGISSIPR